MANVKTESPKVVALVEDSKGPMVYRLIGQAIGKIGAIGKDSVATNFSGKTMYKFRGIDAVYNAINPVMAELGLFIIPEILDIRREERLSENKKTLIYSILTVKYTLFAPDGSSVSGTTVGEAMDSGDKSMNKAMSAALKYFIFQTFVIPTEEMKDPDAEVHDLAPVQPVRNDNPPAQVTSQQTLPKEAQAPKPVNPVLNYLANEKAYMGERLGKNEMEMKIWFAEKVNALVKSGAVKPVAWTEMTMEQAKNLVDAIYKTFLTEGGAE